MSLRMLDLFCGLGGASAAMRERGWHVTGLDIEQRFCPDIVGDVGRLPVRGQFDLVWASPPCEEFSRESMPWCATGAQPDLTLVKATLDAIASLRPRWWVLENTRGAQRWIGRAHRVIGPFYLWGFFPPFKAYAAPFKEKLSSSQAAERAKVPYALSLGLALAVEREAALSQREATA